MKIAQSAAALVAACLIAGAPAWSQTINAPGPGQNTGQVIYWAHYMPQIPLSSMHIGTDALPFVTQEGSDVDQAARSMNAALDAGINGFQMLCDTPVEYYEAAHRIKKETGQTMYLAPTWSFGADLEKSANAIADYAVKYAADSCSAKVNGAQVQFFYDPVPWGDSAGVAKVREILKQRGVKVFLAPTVFCIDRKALDRPDLQQWRPWPAFETPKPGQGDWLTKYPFDGIDGWSTSYRTDVATALTEKLKSRSDSVTFFPDVWPGYDSSNREFQAIHCRTHGLATLRDGIRLWTGLGYKQITVVTWNDYTETLMMPCNRNVYGYSEMLRYYHQLAQNGQSPFDAPRFVVAYQPEALLGDQAFFQCDILPEHDTVSCDYVVSFRLANQDGQTVTTLASRVTTGRENDDPFLEVRMDTSELAGKTEVLVPYVTVRQIDHVSGEWRTLYSDVRLAPVRLRHNNLRFARPMIIALDRVASDEEVTLAVKPQSPRSAVVTAATTGKSPLKRLVLAESLLSAGSFRDDDTVAGVPPGQTRLFVRIDIDARTHCRLSVEGGTINERYTPYWRADLCRTVGPVSSLEYDSQQNWGAPWNVFRITGRPDAKITLALDVKGAPQSVATTLAGVIAGNVRQTATLSGKRILVTFVDTTGTTEANLDYPLPPAGSYRRTIPLSEYGEQVHVYHAYALTADGKIAFSLPVVVDTAPKSGRQTVQFVDSQGTYDDFVNDHAEESRSPYGPADLRTVSLPVGDVPYFRLSLDEGVGIALNDAAIGHQFGQAWIQGSTAGRTPGEAAGSGAVSPNEAPYEWLTDGWRGGALRLGESGVIRIRSTSWPYGALTVSARLRAGAANTSGSASTFSIGPLTARLDSGKIDVKQRFTWLEASGAARLLPGWNHVAFVNDLSVLRVYVNGDLVAASAPATPVLQRTHWVPEIRITPIGGTTPLLDGGIDQVEVIGCALDAAGVRAVYSKGRWK